MTDRLHATFVERSKLALHSLYTLLFSGCPNSNTPDYLHEPLSAAPRTYADHFAEAFQALLATSLYALSSWFHWLFREWDPQTTFQNLLWNYTPDLYSLPQRTRTGVETVIEMYDLDPWVVGLVMTVPFVLCLVVVSVLMGAGDQRNEEAAVVSLDKEKEGSCKTQSVAHVVKGNNHSTSWGPMLGSIGFCGGEILAYTPIDITAAMKETPVHGQRHSTENTANSWGSVIGAHGFYGAHVSSHTPYPHLAGKDLGQLLHGGPARSAAGETLAKIGASCVSNTPSEQHQQQKQPAVIAKDNDLPSKLGLFRSVLGTEPDDDDTNGDLSECAPLPSDFKHDGLSGAIDRMMERKGSRSARDRRASIHWRRASLSSTSRNTSDKSHDHSQQRRVSNTSDAAKAGANPSIGSKIMDYTYNSQLLCNVDSISGGLLGTAIFAVAALASTTETSVNYVNEHLPDSVTRFAGDLKESTVNMIHGPSHVDGKDSAIRTGTPQVSGHGPSSRPPKSYAEVAAANTSQRRESLSPSFTKTFAQVVAGTNSDESGVAPMSYAAAVAKGSHFGAKSDDTASKSSVSSVEKEGYDVCDNSDQESQDDEQTPQTDSQHHHEHVKSNSGNHRHRHRHTHHLVIHPHDEVDLSHDHHQEVAAEKQERGHEQEQQVRGQEQAVVVEYTIDEHGNKVPVADERRDSGFDMSS